MNLQQYIDAHKITIESKLISENVPGRRWSCTLSRAIAIEYPQEVAHITDPDIIDVLEHLIIEARSVEHHTDFEKWAKDMGVNPDSRKTEKIYLARLANRDKLRAWLGDLDYQTMLHSCNQQTKGNYIK